MMQFSRMTLGKKARELGFVRDTFEKVCRLADVLDFIQRDALLFNALALKGGTAINLTIFNLPRLSVDVDMDFSENVPREEMLAIRKQITERISKYMTAAGYYPSQKSKTYHALDSFVYEYQNVGGMKDNLKIEINYMLRCHVLAPVRRTVKSASCFIAPLAPTAFQTDSISSRSPRFPSSVSKPTLSRYCAVAFGLMRSRRMSRLSPIWKNC